MKILTHLNLSQNELQNAVLHKLATAPENAVVGQIYFNTTDAQAYIFKENSSWENLGLSAELLAKLNAIEAGADKVLYGTLPEANAENAGKVVIYTGEATETHKPGLAYICTEKDGAYAWTEATPTMVGAETDSATITVENGVISAEVKVKEDKNNAIRVDADGGLYVEATEVGSATPDEDGLMTSDQAAKLEGIEEGAQVNKLEGVQVNGVDLTIDENKKVNLVEATATAAGLMSAADKDKLDKIEAEADVNVIEKVTLNGAEATIEDKVAKIVINNATTEAAGLMAAEDKAKLNAIEANADVNIIEGVKVNGTVATIGEDKIADIQIANASAEANGLMSKEDKAKLDTVAENAKDNLIETVSFNGTAVAVENKEAKIVIENATETTAGLMSAEDKVALAGKQDKLTAGTHVEIAEGNVINVNLPTASADTAGVVKVGEGLAIDENGVLKSTFGGTADAVEWEGVLNAPSTLGSEEGPVGTFSKVTVDKYGLVTEGAQLEADDIPDLSATYVTVAREGKANGVATLDANAKINLDQIPDTLLGNVKFGGTFNPETGVCALVNNKIVDVDGVEYTELTINAENAAKFTGYYFLATSSATLVDIEFQVGDWCISNGTAGWAKVDNTDAVMGVKGDKEDTYRIGQVNITAANVGAVEANAPITGGTFAKVTVDEKGLVTAGEAKITVADISDFATASQDFVAAEQGVEKANQTLVVGADGNVTTVAHKFVKSIGDGSAKSFTVAHNMNTKDIIVQISDATTFEVVYANIAIADENTITLNFANAPAAEAYRVIVIA